VWAKYFVILYTHVQSQQDNKLSANRDDVVKIYLKARTELAYYFNPFSLINDLIYTTGYNHMAHLLDLAFKKSYY